MNPTGSTLARTFECPAWLSLPHIRESSDAANVGTIKHRYMERVAQVGAEQALAEAPENYRAACADIDLAGLPIGAEYRQEVAFAYDVATGKARELGVGLGRDYGALSPTEIACTLDVTGKAEVWDWKFDGFDSTAPAAAVNPQLAFGALCLAALDPSVQSVKVGLIHIRPDGSHWTEAAMLDLFDLDAFAAKLRAGVAKVEAVRAAVARGEVPTVSRGYWCRWCPAAAACPSVTLAIRTVALEPAKSADEILALLTPQTAANAYAKLEAIEAALKPVRSALYLYASEHDIALPDGRVYGAVTTEREEIDARAARKALAELYGPEVAEAACDFETSKAAIGRALRSVALAKKEAGEKVTAKALNEQALEAIRKAGGVKVKTTTAVKEHKASAADSAEEAA